MASSRLCKVGDSLVKFPRNTFLCVIYDPQEVCYLLSLTIHFNNFPPAEVRMFGVDGVVSSMEKLLMPSFEVFLLLSKNHFFLLAPLTQVQLLASCNQIIVCDGCPFIGSTTFAFVFFRKVIL